MSAKAGTFEQTQSGINWTGGWVAAALLVALLAVTMFAMSRSSGSAEPVGTTARFEITDQLSGGPSRVVATTGYEVTGQLSGGPSVVGVTTEPAPPAAPAQPGIRIGDTICHQCR